MASLGTRLRISLEPQEDVRIVPENYCLENRQHHMEQGSGSLTYLIRSLEDNNLYVAKKMELTRENTDRVEEEIMLMKWITGTHENIVQTKNVVFHKGNAILIMPYYQRGDLKSFIDDINQSRQLLTEMQVLAIAYRLLTVLKYLHENRILHRDIKPGNVFIEDTGQLRLGDFGISKRLVHRPYTETCIGTKGFMAPEQGSNFEEGYGTPYTSKVDIYAAGLLLQTLCFGGESYIADCLVFDNQSTGVALPSRFSEPFRRFLGSFCDENPTRRPSAKMLLEDPLLLQYRKLRATEVENNTDLKFLSGIEETHISSIDWPVYCSHVEVPNGMFVCVSGLSPENPEDLGFLEEIWQNEEEEEELEKMKGSIEQIKSTMEHIFLYAFVVAKLKRMPEKEFEKSLESFVSARFDNLEQLKISRLESLPRLENQHSHFTLQYSAADDPNYEHEMNSETEIREVPSLGARLIDAQMLISAFPFLNEAECSSLIFVLNTTPAQCEEEQDGPTVNSLRSVRKFPLSYRILEMIKESREELIRNRNLLFGEQEVTIGPGLMTKDLIRQIFKGWRLPKYSELFRCLAPDKDKYNRLSFETFKTWIETDPLVMLPNFSDLVEELRNSDERDHLQLSENLNWDVRWRRTTRDILFKWIDEILASILKDIIHVTVKHDKGLSEPINTFLQSKLKELGEVFSTKLMLENSTQIEENLLYWTERWVDKGPRMLSLSSSLRKETKDVGVVITWPMFSNDTTSAVPPQQTFRRLRFLAQLSEYIQLFSQASNFMLEHSLIGRRQQALISNTRAPKETPINFIKFLRLITRTSLYDGNTNDKLRDDLERLRVSESGKKTYDAILNILFDKARADMKGEHLTIAL